MSLFQGMDIANASDDPFGIPADTYDAIISEVNTKESKGYKYLAITYTVNSGEYEGREKEEWKRLPVTDNTEDEYYVNTTKGKQAMSFIKQRLGSLGVPESRMNEVKPEDLVGTEVMLTLEKKGDYTNVKSVELKGAPSIPGGFSQEGAAVFSGAKPFGS